LVLAALACFGIALLLVTTGDYCGDTPWDCAGFPLMLFLGVALTIGAIGYLIAAAVRKGSAAIRGRGDTDHE
jgi:hypothetical protein